MGKMDINGWRNWVLVLVVVVGLVGRVGWGVEAPQKQAGGNLTKPPTVSGGELFGMRGYPRLGAGVAKFFPFVDEFGQYVHGDWPGKVHGAGEFEKRKSEEAEDLLKHPGPGTWDEYGGWKEGPTLKGTGFFRVEKQKGKWWLVDPAGKLFFSNGIDCVGEGGDTIVEQRESWFKNCPGNDGNFKEFWGKSWTLHGYYAGKTSRTFDFAGANLKRKYGEGWRAEYWPTVHRRLRSWGINTIGNWSDPTVYLMRKTPYVATLRTGGRKIEGSEGYWQKFNDPFDARFAEGMKKEMARQAGKSVGDAWCVGYFVDNELSWGNEESLATAALMSPGDQPAKKVFVAELKAKYGGIEKLNEAWGAKYASWEALLEGRERPDVNKSHGDLAAFTGKIAEAYFKTVREAIKSAAPKQLYLGCRFAWSNPVAVAVAGKYCDVVSFNIYRRDVNSSKIPKDLDVPMMVGEFHFGALDRGMFHTGLVFTRSQEERAKAYREYVESALAQANIVGVHWFKFQDEPLTGRSLDEENYQIGFVDVCDTPYAETIGAAREVGEEMYRVRWGE